MGARDTAVIVTPQPSAEATELAAQSALAPDHPQNQTSAAAQAFYDLQDPGIRTRLRATVTQAVGQFIDQIKLPGLTLTQRFSYQSGFAARVTPAALERLLADPAVLRIEPDGLLEPHLRQGIPLMAADTPSATYDGNGLSIAICDTGIGTAHPRLGGGGSPIFNAKVIGGYDTGDNDPGPRPNSTTGHPHSTACAGIAAGDLGDSGDYIGGVAHGAKLYAIKISSGTGGSATSSSMIAGWEWAISHQQDDPANPILIINTSFGGGSYAAACDTAVPAMTTAAANAVAAGIALFASSGNDGYCGSMAWPACISYVNSVGAVYDANIGTYLPCVNATYCANKIATTGCATGYYVAESTAADKVTAYSNSASFLTLFATSNQAYTADIAGPGGYSTGDFTSSFGGTSAACPYAAGAAAVLQSASKAITGTYLTPTQVKSYLTTYGDTLTDGKVISVQKPRINLARAVSALPTKTTVTVTASDNRATEVGLTTGTFTFSRSGDTAPTLNVIYSVTGTATPGSDYQVLGTSVSFAAGASTATRTVTPLQDSLVEAEETILLTLTPGSGYSPGSPASATVTLTSDDLASYSVTATADAHGTISPASQNVAHGATTSFTVTPETGYSANVTGCGGSLSGNTYTTGPITAPCTVSASFSLNSYTVTATAGAHGSIDPASRLVAQGATTTFTVTPETGYSANVTGCGGSLNGTTYTTGAITAPCAVSALFVPQVSVVATDKVATESGLTTGTFTFTRGGDTTSALTLSYRVAGTATPSQDYKALGTSVTIPMGASQVTKTLVPRQDPLVEPAETIILTLVPRPNYARVKPASAKIILRSDD